MIGVIGMSAPTVFTSFFPAAVDENNRAELPDEKFCVALQLIPPQTVYILFNSILRSLHGDRNKAKLGEHVESPMFALPTADGVFVGSNEIEIEIVLDMDERSVSFSRRNPDFFIAKASNVAEGEVFRLGVSSMTAGEKIVIVE